MECNNLDYVTITNIQKLHSTILNSKVSKNIRNQGETLFCWAFAISTMIRQSLNLLLKDVEHEKLDEALAKLNSNDFHRQLRNEIIMIPIPKNLSSEHNKSSPLNQGHYLKLALERVSSSFYQKREVFTSKIRQKSGNMMLKTKCSGDSSEMLLMGWPFSSPTSSIF